MTSERYVNRTVRMPSPTRPKQKYRCSLALCEVSSAMTQFGSPKAYCASANGTPCLVRFEPLLRLSQSNVGPSMLQRYHRYGCIAIYRYGAPRRSNGLRRTVRAGPTRCPNECRGADLSEMKREHLRRQIGPRSNPSAAC